MEGELVIGGMSAREINTFYNDRLKPQCRISHFKLVRMVKKAETELEKDLIVLKERYRIVEFHMVHGFDCHKTCKMELIGEGREK